MFALNILQLRPADDIYLPPSRPSSARAHRPPPSFSSSSSSPSLVVPSIHVDQPPSHLLPANPPDGFEGFLLYFNPTCAKARSLEAEVDILTRGRQTPLVTSNLPEATHVLVDSQSRFGGTFFRDQGSDSFGRPFLLDLSWIEDSISSERWQHETDYLYHPPVSSSVLATLFPEEEPSPSRIPSTSVPLDDANEVEDVPVEPVQEVQLATEPVEGVEPRIDAGVEEGAEAVARVESEGADEMGNEDEDVTIAIPANSPHIPSEEPSDDGFATFLAALDPNVNPWNRDHEGRDTFDLYVVAYPNQTADWWRTRFQEKTYRFISFMKALRSQSGHGIEKKEMDPSRSRSEENGALDGLEVVIREEAANDDLPPDVDDPNQELEKPVEEPTEMESVEPVCEEIEPSLSLDILEEMFMELRDGLELRRPVMVEDPPIVTFEAGTDIQLSPEVDVAHDEGEEPVGETSQTDTVELANLNEVREPTPLLEIHQETKEQQSESHHSPSSSSSSSTSSSSTHSIYSTPGSSPSPSSSQMTCCSPVPSSPKRSRVSSIEASNPLSPILDASRSNSSSLPLPVPLPLLLLSPSPTLISYSPRPRQQLSSSLSPPPDLPPSKPFEPPSFLRLGVPSSFLSTPSSSSSPTCFFCGFEAEPNKSIQRNPICLSCFDWLDEKIDEQGEFVEGVEELEDEERLAWALSMWKVNGLRERRGRVRVEDGGTMVVEWRGGEL